MELCKLQSLLELAEPMGHIFANGVPTGIKQRGEIIGFFSSWLFDGVSVRNKYDHPREGSDRFCLMCIGFSGIFFLAFSI